MGSQMLDFGVFDTTVDSRLTFTSTAWSEFVTAADIQRVNAFPHRSRN